jgi:5'-nucleotidase (lipoprotein e(P4) family)
VHRRLRAAAWLSALLFSCQSWTRIPAEGEDRSHEGLDAVLWVQTSAEWEAAAEQVFRVATRQLDAALEPGNIDWTASLEQGSDAGDLPPAVVLDVDEVVLDSSRFQTRLVERRVGFRLEDWNAWAREADAAAVPGALEFAKHAEAKGVRIFYVTNRDVEIEAATRRNLEKLGFPVDSGGENLLSRNERKGWGSDKRSRRRFIAADHRIVLLVGDDLNDFVSGSQAPPGSRRELARRWGAYWGTKWIVMPNPMYGSWERSLYGFDRSLSRSERLRRKQEKLEPTR